MTAIWKVSSCDRVVILGGESDVITKVHWEVTDEETVNSNIHYGRQYGAVGIDTSDLSYFIAYDAVTEADAVEWAKAALGSDEVERLETDVASQIALSKTPVTGHGVPW